MGEALAEAFPAARAVFDEVDAALGEKLTGDHRTARPDPRSSPKTPDRP